MALNRFTADKPVWSHATEYVVITRFNEDEIVSVELIEKEFSRVVEDYYAAQGFGVCVEAQQ